ncbi:MAG: prohibitin family protein [Bacteroidota bacterium]
MNKHLKFSLYCLMAGVFLSSCATIRPGEVGMKQTIGKLKPKVYESGAVGYNPFVTTIVKVPTRTENLEVKLELPSKDGLNVAAEISILYRINSAKAPEIIENIGSRYEEVVILSVFRSAAADVCSRFMAKDMYTESRAAIERDVQSLMMDILADKGFLVERVLLKSITLPRGLARAIEQKLETEQVAQRMEFELQREKMEAERKKIEAEGIRDAQKIIEQGLTRRIIEWQSIEAFKMLSQSANAKLIITNGSAPFLIDGLGALEDSESKATSMIRRTAQPD